MSDFLMRTSSLSARTSRPLLAMAALLAASTTLAADESKPAPAAQEATSQADAVPNLPVQEGDDPIKVFVPANPITSEEKLKGDALAWFMTAQLHYSRGETAEGLAALKKTIEKDGTSLTPYRALVPALLESRDIDGAREYALKGAALKPEGIILAQGVALALARLNKIDDAIGLLTETLPLAPRDTAMGQHLSLQRQIGTLNRIAARHKEAAEHYKIVFDALKSPDNKLTPEKFKQLLGEPGALYDEFGQVFLLASQPELALQAFDEASKFSTARPAIHSYNLALLFRETKKPAEALTELDKYFAAQLQTKGRAAYQLLKEILVDLKREGELLDRLEQLHKVDAQNAALAFFLADQYVVAGRFDDAQKTYVAAPGGSRDPRALVGLVGVYRHQKNIPELFTSLTRAFQVVPVAATPSVAMDPEISELSQRYLAEQEAISADEVTMTALIEHARKLQGEDPPKLEFVPAYYIGKLSIDANRSDDALGFYRYAISMQNTPPAQLYWEIALHLIQVDKFKPAVEILQDAIQHPSLDDERAALMPLQAYALEMDGQTERALAVVAQAKKDFPRELNIHEREAWVFYHSQQWEKAIAAYEALIETAPSLNANQKFLNGCRFSLSAIYVHLENFDKGEKILEDILEKDPENTQANNDLGYLWADRGKNLDKAKVMIEKALASEPENAAYLDSMGWIQFRLGNYSEAREHLAKAVKDPRRQDATIWDHLGDVYDKQGEREEAIKAWVKALEIEFEKAKPEEKLVKALTGKIPPDRLPPMKPKEAGKAP